MLKVSAMQSETVSSYSRDQQCKLALEMVNWLAARVELPPSPKYLTPVGLLN